MPTSQTPEVLQMVATSFPQFSSLPGEIRHLIWQFAAFPRIVYLEYVADERHTCSRVWSETSIEGPESMGFFDLDHQPEIDRYSQGPDPIWRFRSQGIPPLFLVCSESYHVAEEIYTKSFGSGYTVPSTWFNFELDILYLEQNILYSYMTYEFGEEVKKVQNLAMYNGWDPIDYNIVGSVIDNFLSYFENVRSLTLVNPQHENDDCADLVFLDLSDIVESPEYSVSYRSQPHPIAYDLLSNLRSFQYYSHSSDRMWNEYPYSYAVDLRNRTGGGLKKWEKPNLQCKLVTTYRQKVEFLKHKEEFNKEREAKRVNVVLTAENYNSLEVSVPVLTKVADLTSMFCQARGIDIEVNNDTMFISALSIQDDDAGIPLSWNMTYFQPDDENENETLRIDLIFYDTKYRRKCLCDDVFCCHTKRFQRTLWMESEDWGLQDLFET